MAPAQKCILVSLLGYITEKWSYIEKTNIEMSCAPIATSDLILCGGEHFSLVVENKT